jgi:hypothetical protein
MLVADFPNQELVANPNRRLGTFTNVGASGLIECRRSSGV